MVTLKRNLWTLELDLWTRELDLWTRELDLVPLPDLRYATAMLCAVGLVLSVDGKAHAGQLLLSPEDFGGPSHLGTFDRDRRVSLEFGTLTLGVGSLTPIVSSLAAEKCEDQREQAKQNEKGIRGQP